MWGCCHDVVILQSFSNITLIRPPLPPLALSFPFVLHASTHDSPKDRCFSATLTSFGRRKERQFAFARMTWALSKHANSISLTTWKVNAIRVFDGVNILWGDRVERVVKQE